MNVNLEINDREDSITFDRLAKCLDNYEASQINIPGVGNVKPTPFRAPYSLWAIHNEYGLIAIVAGRDEQEALDTAIEADMCKGLACDSAYVDSLPEEEREELYCADGDYFDLQYCSIVRIDWQSQSTATQVIMAYLIGKASA